MRKFGRIKIVATEDVEKTGLVGKMGPEPFNGLTQKVFKELLGKSKKAIKILIMDQHKISGIGNIYANDALWLAGLSPMKPANELNTKVVIKLYKSILKVLEEGIKYGGASENAFVTPDGTDGNYQKHILVYGTAGQLCKKPKCRKLGAKIKRVAQGGRGTYYCTNCQTDKS
jgi:formamidopyrimidine-DNA glycosylase